MSRITNGRWPVDDQLALGTGGFVLQPRTGEVGMLLAKARELDSIRDHAAELAVAAVTLRPGETLAARDLTRALADLPAGARPDVVEVVAEIAVTSWYRPESGPLREAGLPEAGDEARPAWYLDGGGERYRPLTESARRRLSARERPVG